MKIDACLIVKNEEENIANVIEQLLEFSQNIYIVDTGSTDKTQEIIQSYSNHNVHLGYYEWNYNFADARNYAASLSRGADYIFWCDGDEKLQDEFIKRLKEFAAEEYSEDMPDVYTYGMITFIKPDPNSHSKVYERAGIFKANKDIKFCNPIHETLDYCNNTSDHERFAGFMLSNFYDKVGEEKYRNFDIFGNVQSERSLTCREMFYSGRELGDLNFPVGKMLFVIESILHTDWHTEAIDALYDYIELYDNFESCRNINCIKIADIVKHMFDNRMLNRCVLVKFSKTLFNIGEYELSIKCAEYAYNMSDAGIAQIITAYEYDDIDCMFMLVLAHDKLCNYKSANDWNNKILAIDPNNQSALHNKEYFKSLT